MAQDNMILYIRADFAGSVKLEHASHRVSDMSREVQKRGLRLLLGLIPQHQNFLKIKTSNTQPYPYNSTDTAFQHPISISNCSLKKELLTSIKVFYSKATLA